MMKISLQVTRSLLLASLLIPTLSLQAADLDPLPAQSHPVSSSTPLPALEKKQEDGQEGEPIPASPPQSEVSYASEDYFFEVDGERIYLKHLTIVGQLDPKCDYPFPIPYLEFAKLSGEQREGLLRQGEAQQGVRKDPPKVLKEKAD